MASALRAVKQPPAAVVPVTKGRAGLVYPAAPVLAAKWFLAVQWMQRRPRGSVWLLDVNRPPAKWRAEVKSHEPG